MSVHFETIVAFGVYGSQVIKVEQTVETITKYDPDTGKPYEKKTTTEEWRVGNQRWEDFECGILNNDDLEAIILDNDRNDPDDYFVGLIYDEIQPSNSETFSIEGIQKTMTAACDAINQLGFNFAPSEMQMLVFHQVC